MGRKRRMSARRLRVGCIEVKAVTGMGGIGTDSTSMQWHGVKSGSHGSAIRGHYGMGFRHTESFISVARLRTARRHFLGCTELFGVAESQRRRFEGRVFSVRHSCIHKNIELNVPTQVCFFLQMIYLYKLWPRLYLLLFTLEADKPPERGHEARSWRFVSCASLCGHP